MSACAGVASLWQAARPKASSRANRPGRDFMAELPCVWHESQAMFKGFSPGGRGHNLAQAPPASAPKAPHMPSFIQRLRPTNSRTLSASGVSARDSGMGVSASFLSTPQS
jgi:hypothetical protein